MIKAADKRSSPPTRMAKSIRGVVADMFTLGELQIQLFKADLHDGRTKLTQGIILLVASVTLLLASLPVALLALSYGLVAAFEIPLWAALAIASAVGFLIGAILLYAGSRWLSKSLSFFQRSSEELANNVNWIKNMTSANRDQSMAEQN